ncbi:MAG: dockerin type I domain-containing protein [Pirellulales bacterium]
MSRFALLARQWSVASLTLLWMTAPPARAVVVSASNLAVTAVTPGDDPGWNNVALRGAASAVYLGNRWVLTADHVGAGSIQLSDGRVLDMVPGSGTQLTNAGIAAAGAPDLRMFRLADDPGLPTLQIDTVRPPAGSPVTMIGAGRDRATGLDGWHVTGVGVNTVWTPSGPPLANVHGYSLLDTFTKRWGMNEVASNQILINNTTVGFSTRFDRPGFAFEGQAVTGDSGGGVFRKVDGAWKLVGIMTAQQSLTNQPAGTVVPGNLSQIADLAAYRSQILGLLTRADPAWQNQRNYFDVNGSGFVSPLDYLVIFNELIRANSHALVGSPATTRQYYDVNGDAMVSQLDALRIINALTAGSANPPSVVPLASDTHFIPEPSTGALAFGGLLLAVARCLKIARRGRAK